MIFKDYYSINEIKLAENVSHHYLTSRNNSKYVQHIKLGFLYLFNIYKGTARNKSFDVRTNDINLNVSNTQLRFIPADVYYKRDVEYNSNSVVLNVLLSVLKYNPKYNEYIQEIYNLIDEKFSLNISTEFGVNLNIEADEINLKKILSLLEIKLVMNHREIEEVDLTEYELKCLYLEILNLMSVQEEKVIYLIESPEAGLNYKEKMLFMNKVSKFDNIIVFTNDVDILKFENDIKKINIIDYAIYHYPIDKLLSNIEYMFINKTKEEIYLETSNILMNNLDKVLNSKDINQVEDDKVRNIILNYLDLINML